MIWYVIRIKAKLWLYAQGIERYNPDNIKTLEHYVELQVRLIIGGKETSSSEKY